MSSSEHQNSNCFWEETKYQIVCDRWGNPQSAVTYSEGYHLRIQANLDYQLLTDKEAEDIQRIEQKKRAFIHQRNQSSITQILQLAEKHFSPVQKHVLLAFLQGKTWQEISIEQGCSEASIRQVFRGNSKGEGGIVRKLRKLMVVE
ncbi:MAG: hypothetical protein DWQ10_10895 [Calditrichaeota bacterium]|nr:MAG: hypothetical protein DWQ10_10895 [Calditrichota bacterium]